MPNLLHRSDQRDRQVRAVHGLTARLPVAVLTRLNLRRADTDLPAPVRTGVEECTAPGCLVVALDAAPSPMAFDINPGEAADRLSKAITKTRRLPYTAEELKRCEVPPQSEKTSSLKPTAAVLDSRPDQAPVWCPEGCGWFHSSCYSTHHHDGWTPTVDKRHIPALATRKG